MSCTCTGTTTSTGRLAWGTGAGGSGAPSRGSPQDARVSAPLLLLLPNNILVLSELQTETPASVILLRRGCAAIGGHWTLPTLHGWVPMRVPSAAGLGTWGKFAVGILASVGPATAGSCVCPFCVTLRAGAAAGSPAPCQGSRCPGTPAFCWAQRMTDGRTRRSWSRAGIPAVHSVAGYRHARCSAVRPPAPPPHSRPLSPPATALPRGS